MAEDYRTEDRNILGCSLDDLENDYFQYIDLLTYDETVYARIAELLKE